jgi:hypothetical protein
MFSSKNLYHYLAIFSIVIAMSYIVPKIKQSFETNNEYELIKKYLLNDSPLYGFNKPKLWIHSKYEINARKWKSFYSRNSTDLNQPYIHLTIKTIINHCGNDFNICLIDDDTFSKLIPSWDIDLEHIAEPHKSQYRHLGMMELLYYYGGMTLPNSFLCMKNLKELYNSGIAEGNPFVCENINHSTNIVEEKQKLLFTPDVSIMGAPKNHPIILEMVEDLKRMYSNGHFSNEMEFLGKMSHWCKSKINVNSMNLIGGEHIGVKTQKRKPILLENLMEEDFLDTIPNIFGIYIPAEKLLKRTKYQWFAVLPSEEVLKSNAIIVKHLKASLVDSTDEYYKTSEIRSVVAI